MVALSLVMAVKLNLGRQNMARHALSEVLLKQTQINDPFLGETSPQEFKQNSMLWPSDKWAKIEAFHTTIADGLEVQEYRYYKDKNSDAYLPVAFVFAKTNTGSSIVYVYSDHHLVDDRKPILPPIADFQPWQDENDVLYSYFKALKANQLETVMSFFTQDAYFQHSNGECFIGHDEIRGDFVKMLGDDGIQIKYCRAIDNGSTCVLEVYMPSGRPAIAVYERNGELLKSVRIYL